MCSSSTRMSSGGGPPAWARSQIAEQDKAIKRIRAKPTEREKILDEYRKAEDSRGMPSELPVTVPAGGSY
jgi:hypothetical protein